MARRGRSRKRFLGAITVLGAIGAVGVYYEFYLPMQEGADSELVGDGSIPVDHPPLPRLTSNRPESPPQDADELADAPVRGDNTDVMPAAAPGPIDHQRAVSLVASGRQAAAAGDLVLARAQLGEAYRAALTGEQRVAVRAELVRLANETVFSARVTPNDPLVDRYIIQPGDNLQRIARNNLVSSDFLASVNGIKNKNRIRAGQTIKVVHGPFRAVVHKSGYDIDVYLQDTFVRHYPVGLGAEDRTPSGRWKVGAKLMNPTYYPPRGGQIIAAEDPDNPLGERWIGLIGIDGEALGQQRYGIHGTIDPDSIGQSVSLGCVRLYNKDVAELYNLLVEEKSLVVIE